MRSFNDSISRKSGSKASRNSWLSPLAASRFYLHPVPHFFSRSPYDFVKPRAAFTSAVRVLTSGRSGADHRQMDLRLGAAMSHRPQ